MAGSIRSEAYQGLIRAMVRLRGERGLSQAQLAARLGKPQSFVGKFELGERRLDLVEALVVLRALDTDPIAFLNDNIGDLPEHL